MINIKFQIIDLVFPSTGKPDPIGMLQEAKDFKSNFQGKSVEGT
jgi:hypothetical protein